MLGGAGMRLTHPTNYRGLDIGAGPHDSTHNGDIAIFNAGLPTQVVFNSLLELLLDQLPIGHLQHRYRTEMDDAHKGAGIALVANHFVLLAATDAEITRSALQIARLQAIEQAAIEQHVVDFMD